MKIKKCFVIGPMNEKYIDNLHWLAEHVVAKILAGRDFIVFTPDVHEAGNIMNHVIKSADRSDLVIADITGNNPNVLYEVGLLNSMGRSCIAVKQVEKGSKKVDYAPFDIAQYRFFQVPARNTKAAIKVLQPVINDALKRQEEGEIPSNPVTDFFGVALSSLSSAHGLSRGYFRNFILPAITGEIESIDGEPKQFIGAKELDIHIVIPMNLVHSTRWAVEKLIAQGKIVPVVMKAPGRKLNAFVWNGQLSDKPVLVDIPTAMGQLRDNVIARLGQLASKDPKSYDYIELEQNEIAQFKTYLQGFIFKEPESPVNFKAKIIDVENSLCLGLFDDI